PSSSNPSTARAILSERAAAVIPGVRAQRRNDVGADASRPLFPLLAALALPDRLHAAAFVLVGDEAAIVVRLVLLLQRAGIDRVEVLHLIIRQIRTDIVAN